MEKNEGEMNLHPKLKATHQLVPNRQSAAPLCQPRMVTTRLVLPVLFNNQQAQKCWSGLLMFLKALDLTTALRPLLLPDETLLFVQDAVGLYEG